jgi:hypothetical protein
MGGVADQNGVPLVPDSARVKLIQPDRWAYPRVVQHLADGRVPQRRGHCRQINCCSGVVTVMATEPEGAVPCAADIAGDTLMVAPEVQHTVWQFGRR